MEREPEPVERTSSAEEVSEIIDTATRLLQLADERTGGNELTMDQLAEIAEELGISRDALARAISTGDRQARSERSVSARRAQWFRHVSTYLIVISALASIDWVTGDGFTFFFFQGWGVGVAIHAMSAFQRH